MTFTFAVHDSWQTFPVGEAVLINGVEHVITGRLGPYYEARQTRRTQRAPSAMIIIDEALRYDEALRDAGAHALADACFGARP